MPQPLSVAVWGTGQVGQACIRLVQNDPRLRLSGAIVHSADKEGRDAGELAGITPLGIQATRSIERGLAGADAILHTTLHDPQRNCEELCSALALGVNAVSLASFSFPYEFFPDLAHKLDETAIAHGVSIHGTRINPGFVMDVFPLVLSSVTSSIERVWCQRVTEMSRFPRHMVKFLGVNQRPEDGLSNRLLSGIHTEVGQALLMLAAGLGLRLDEVVHDQQPIVAQRRCEANGHVASAPGDRPGRREGAHRP